MYEIRRKYFKKNEESNNTISFVTYKYVRESILNKALGIWPVKLLKLKSLDDKRN